MVKLIASIASVARILQWEGFWNDVTFDHRLRCIQERIQKVLVKGDVILN